MFNLESKLAHHKLSLADILIENGHSFVDMTKLGFQYDWKTCLVCGSIRRADGKNNTCKGPKEISLRTKEETKNA